MTAYEELNSRSERLDMAGWRRWRPSPPFFI
jgi:hypothetical protein